MQLYFIRHAQSKNNALWDQTGSSKGRSEDPELTETGLRQAEALAEFINGDQIFISQNGRDPQNIHGFGLTHLYCSLMTRSVQTASAVARKLNLPLHGWVEIHETGGIFLEDEISGKPVGRPGKGRSDFLRLFPELVVPEVVTEAGWWNRPMEEEEEFAQRASKVLASILERHGNTEDRVALVSHGGFFNSFMHVYLNIPQKSNVWFLMNNTAITRIDFHGGESGVIYMNRTDHLPKKLIT